MKRIYLIILMALVAMTGFAQQRQTGDYVYVYEKDGNVLSFLRDEIDEMGYSNYDTLGVAHDEVVSQIISLAEEAYIIPLADIDSISFVTPPTVLQPGVTDLAPSLAQYAVDSKELTLYLSGSTPQSLLPAVGSRVVLAERSFAGDVASVTQEDGLIVVKVNYVDLEEIFATYYALNFIDLEDDGTASVRTKSIRRAKDYEKKIKLPAVGFEIDQEIINLFLPGDDELPAEAKFSAKVQPTITIKASLVINKGKHASVGIVGDFNFTEQLTFKGKIEESVDLVKPKDVIDIPLGETFLFFYNRWGFQLKAAAELSVDLKWQQLYRATFDWSYNSKAKQQKKPEASFNKVSEDFTPEGSIKGSMTVGPYTDISIKFVITELAKAALHIEAGLEFAGEYVLVNKDIVDASNSTKFYEFLKAQKAKLNFVLNSSIDLSFLETEQSIDLPWSINKNLVTLDYVPTFSDVTFERDGNNGAASAKISGTCILPMKTGFIVCDKDDKNLDTWTTEKSYWAGGSQMSHTFSNLEEDQEYALHPKVVILGHDIKATPKAGVKADEFPVHIINFEQTDANYSEVKGYTFEGKGYYYKFNVTTTVELDKDAKNIKDWGYIYHDIYNVDKKISCADLGSNPYADTRWAYYYDEPQRTVSLTAYVQYEGETDIKKGGTHTYTVKYGGCPDNNHPHMIDLGLPSGTKWACCNVGASSPEQTGGYYAWGETHTKLDYWGDTYQFWFDADGDGYFSSDFIELDTGGAYMVTNEILDIGTDIANTQYDVATVQWGAPWRMPSLEQIKELYAHTTCEWTEEKGVKGCRFKGSNFGILFIPASGEYRSEDIYNYGKLVGCWSSTQYRDSQFDPLLYSWGIYNDGRAVYGANFRFYGLPVRPVK